MCRAPSSVAQDSRLPYVDCEWMPWLTLASFKPPTVGVLKTDDSLTQMVGACKGRREGGGAVGGGG